MKESIGCSIYLNFRRPDKGTVEKFKGLPVANLDDNMNRIAAASSQIRPVNRGKLLGSAFTIKVPQGDNLMLHKALDYVEPGDVLVIDAGGGTDRAILGEIIVTYCRIKGVAGILLDGCIRDSEYISHADDFPVFCCGISPNGPYKNGPGKIGCDVSVGGIVVHPGDIIVGDEDGVVAVSPDIAQELIKKTLQTAENENQLLDTMKTEGTYIRPWVDEKLKALNVEYME